MSAKRHPPSWVALAVVLAAAPMACRADDPRVKFDYDVVYTKAGGAELKLDLARPATGKGPFPAVLVIHGGGWQKGNKRDSHGAMGEFARHGYVAVSPQYRFAPKDPFPAQVHDVKAAVRWVKGHAKEYQVDAEHVGAVGFSAGGHLSLMLGLTGPADGLEGEVSSVGPDTKIAAVVNFFGPTDLAAADLPTISQNLVRDLLGSPSKDTPGPAAKASPLTYVSRGDPPVLTFQGTKDPLVPHTQATRLADAMTAAGVPGRVELLVGAGHGWVGDDLQHTLVQTIDFFDHHLKPAGTVHK